MSSTPLQNTNPEQIRLLDMLTTTQAAVMLGAPRPMVQRWCQEGRFPGARKVGRDWLISAADLATFTRPKRGDKRAGLVPPPGCESQPQAARRLGVSRQRVHQMIAQGKLETFLHNGRTYIKPPDKESENV